MMRSLWVAAFVLAASGLLAGQDAPAENTPASPAAESHAPESAAAPAADPHAEAPAGHGAPAESHGPAAAAHGEPAAHGAAAGTAHEAGGGEHHSDDPGAVMMHHVLDQPFFGLPSKHLVFFLIAALLVIVVVRLALAGYDKAGVPRGIAAAVETLVLFVRDEIAEKNIGHDGRKFTPLLLSFFFFILFAALLGLMPFSATSTGNLAVTMALALISLGAQQWAGISKYGLAHHLHNLIPPGLPFWLLPIMIPVELIGVFTKPFALMVRLFANMLAGHLVITALLLLVPVLAKVNLGMGIAAIPVSLSLALFIMMLEVLVAFIQAFIFTLLSAIFIGMYAHPSH